MPLNLKKREIKELTKLTEEQTEVIKKYERKERLSKEERDMQIAIQLSLKTVSTEFEEEKIDKMSEKCLSSII